jgi:inosine-uridine nucleoside N-ribohydrolase
MIRPVYAESLVEHFAGSSPKCVQQYVPTLIVADVTRTGEIDDTISLFMYRELEKMHCIKVIGVVSIFGNGGSSTGKVHSNLVARLNKLSIDNWQVFRGPDRRMSFAKNQKFSDSDATALSIIANEVNKHENVVIAELGPLTVSACLLKSGMVAKSKIQKILGVGGRSPKEHFSPNANIPFSFRDMNVAEDRAAISYLVAAQSLKLWMVTYQTGIGTRMIDPQMVSSLGNSDLTTHAHKRAKKLKMIGYGGKIPSWDTWTTSWFIQEGHERLGCKKAHAAMIHESQGFKPTDSMQLQLFDQQTGSSRQIETCHQQSNAGLHNIK